jgi:hypothetical protein
LVTNWPLDQLRALPARVLAGAFAVASYAESPTRPARGAWASLGGVGPSADLRPGVDGFVYEAGLWIATGRDEEDGIPADLARLADPRWRGRIALDDPTLARGPILAVLDLLGSGGWSSRYHTVLKLYVNSPPPRPGLQVAAARVREGRAVAALGVRPSWLGDAADGLRFRRLAPAVGGVEWFGASGEGGRELIGRLGLGADEEAGRGASSVMPRRLSDPVVARLATLIRVACVESHAELRSALEAIERAESTRPRAAARASRWLGEPQPWPPASVGVLRGKRGGDRLVSDLAGHLTTNDPDRRALEASWAREPSPLDGVALASIPRPASPFFDAWLRAEWGAWCRQRYRRAARLAEAAGRGP